MCAPGLAVDRELGLSTRFNPGNDRLSHAVPRAVPWALEGLTTVFGMGTGVSPPVRSPETRRNSCQSSVYSQQLRPVTLSTVNC